jgi:hypothetical protein
MTSPSSGIRAGRLPSAPSLVGKARALFHGLVPSGDHQLSHTAYAGATSPQLVAALSGFAVKAEQAWVALWTDLRRERQRERGSIPLPGAIHDIAFGMFLGAMPVAGGALGLWLG